MRAASPLSTGVADAGENAGAALGDTDTAVARAHQHFDAGVARMQAGDDAGAIAAFGAALALQPQLVEAHINLGLLLCEADSAAAERHYRSALAIDPLRLEGYLHLGALLASRRRFDQAELLYRQALALDPASPAALSNLGVLLASTGRAAQAVACYRAALAIDPAYQGARFNWAYLLLRDGQFEDGWRAFEGRRWYRRFADYFAFPRWDGEPLAGKRLMIAVEAGHGDMIQFCRYALLARDAGAARVGLVCHAGLRRLFTSLAGIDVFSVDDDVPRSGWDYWTPPLSMPYHFRTRLDSIPAPLPYLAPPATNVPRLPVDVGQQGLKVGLVWQGNPRFDNDRERSIGALATLAPLAAVSGVAWYSLQKGAGELANSHANANASASAWPGLTDLAPLIGDFADTAALVAQLDLVISVDTALAHLAGALGVPCWLLLPAYQTDWRWLEERRDTPWYPGVMRLFRQPPIVDWHAVAQRDTMGDWDSVVAEVVAALRLRLERD